MSGEQSLGEASLAQTLALWSDDPASTDFLAFSAVAATVADAVMDDELDPVALGLSGTWGSGKTTVLQLVEIELQTRVVAGVSSEDPEKGQRPQKVLVVRADPWRFDPTTGAKESLISEVLGSLAEEIGSSGTGGAKDLVKRLAKRVDWAKAIRMAAKTSITLQLPKLDDVIGLVREGDDDGEVRGLEAFRSEFASLMDSPELAHVLRVVVLVDDLDRCLTETVIDTLEAIRLFLAVPKMSFVIAADEERVADAIRTRFPRPDDAASPTDLEEPAKLYLHKIVQTTIPLPALSRFDTEAYLLLLQVQRSMESEQMSRLIEQCALLRNASRSLDELPGLEGIDLVEELSFAARLTPILYEKLRGNPRRIKRFLNDLHIRRAIALRRGISLASDVVAKLMVLEVLVPVGFDEVLDWLAHGKLRERVESLEVAAGRTQLAEPPSPTEPPDVEDDAKDSGSDVRTDGEEFSEDLIRWARLAPSLATVDLAPYLHLAAAFSGEQLLDTGLPPALRDLAAHLLSSVRAEQRLVTDENLGALSAEEAVMLVRHLGRAARDRPSDQMKAVKSMLRLARVHPSTTGDIRDLLFAVPPDEVEPATALLFTTELMPAFRPVLERWTATHNGPTKQAVQRLLTGAN